MRRTGRLATAWAVLSAVLLLSGGPICLLFQCTDALAGPPRAMARHAASHDCCGKAAPASRHGGRECDQPGRVCGINAIRASSPSPQTALNELRFLGPTFAILAIVAPVAPQRSGRSESPPGDEHRPAPAAPRAPAGERAPPSLS